MKMYGSSAANTFITINKYVPLKFLIWSSKIANATRVFPVPVPEQIMVFFPCKAFSASSF